MISELDALAAITLGWVHDLDDVWHTSPVHVDGVHTQQRTRILAKLDQTTARNPIGVVIQGQAGTGKTHLLGWTRQQVVARGGYFFLLGAPSGENFGAGVVSAMLADLWRELDGETQADRFLRRLCEQLALPPRVAAALLGDATLRPKHLKDLLTAFGRRYPALIRQCRETLAAFVLYKAGTFDDIPVGDAYLRSLSEQEPGERARWGIRSEARPPMEIVHDLSRLLALTGPSILAMDQIDGVVTEAPVRGDGPPASGDGDLYLNALANGLLVLHERTERTLCLLTCLPATWIRFRERAVTSLRDRFSDGMPLSRLDDPAITSTIVERRLGEEFGRIGFIPPYPTWPVARAAFDGAPQYTPRELLQRIVRHVDECLADGVVRELHDFTDQVPGRLRDQDDIIVMAPRTDDVSRAEDEDDVDGDRQEDTDQDVQGPDGGGPRIGADPALLVAIDAEFAGLRTEVPAVIPANEDFVVPALLNAGLTAWIAENGAAGADFDLDPSPSTRPPLHARLSRTLDRDTGEQAHWCFRAITASHGNAILPRITTACTSAGIVAGNPRRQLFLLRGADSEWSRGAKTQQALTAFADAGGRLLPLDPDDLATFTALRTLLDQRRPGLRDWLTSRRPASTTSLLRTALANATGARGATGSTAEVAASDGLGARKRGSTAAVPPTTSTPASAYTSTSTPASAWAPTPMSTSRSASTFVLGAASADGASARVDLSVLRRHVAIFAGSGSGKTVLIRRLVEECALRGVSSIVLDPNNDLARLGDAWPASPSGWADADADAAAEYLAATDVVIWTPRRDGGRPLSFQPLPDFASLRDDPDEFEAAIDAAVATLAARANVTGNTARASVGRAILTAALRHFARGNRTGLASFVDLLADLPDGIVEGLDHTNKRPIELAQALRAAMVTDPLFGGQGEPVDPATLLRPADGRRARISVISMVGLPQDEQRQSFVNQLQLALFSWVKRNPAGERPLGGLFVMDEAQTFAPAGPTTACTASTLVLASQARKYGLGLVFATQAPKNLHNGIPGNATTQLFGRLNAPTQIDAARMMARNAGGDAPDIGQLGVGEFYATSESLAFEKIRTPLCLSHHPSSPLTAEEVIDRARRD
ncbi:conserved hypothetical protein [Frankia canadensis]|uniref:AAA+ ATPase domain-containing protein n=1 Tax=Frankia canadensis TaxID=1836972 RepID=A0A2I2KMR7_9ACTN|nr:DUF87 domain-containing protein [Frankia canadensis]SNQ46961.1 conserved hypothetical protein [Frankia canadensis]SOU54251.1 conserved hypothetical protein [Frankia canadensis]